MKKVIFIFLLLVVSSTFVSANWLDDLLGLSPSTASMQIRVKDANTNAYLSGATVVFRVDGNIIATKTTDSNGLTASVSIEVGKSLYLDVSKTGYTSRTNINTGLVPSTGGIRDALLTSTTPTTRQVRVLIKDNLGNPLSGANVKFKIGTTIAFTQTTDSTGYTPYVNLNVGEYYTGEASKTGYSTNTWNIGTIVSGTAWSIGPYVLTSTTPSTRQVKVLIKDNL